MTYEDLIYDLKHKLHSRKISFKRIFKLLTNRKYDEIIEIIHDETIERLIVDIVSELEKIGFEMEHKLNDLVWLNYTLLQFGEEPQPSITKARKYLKKNVFINMFDLHTGKYDKRTTRDLLRKELINKPERRFPLQIAKRHITLKCFLIMI